MSLVPFVSAQTPHRDLRYDVFRAFGAGSEIGLSVRELSNDEVSKAGLELPAPRAARARLGITAMPLTNQLAEYFGVREGGVLVSAVEERSPSATAGLKAGDVIIAIDGAPVRTPQDVTAAARREWLWRRESELLLKRNHDAAHFDVVAPPLTFEVRANGRQRC
jgi:hypothetical protein